MTHRRGHRPTRCAVPRHRDAADPGTRWWPRRRGRSRPGGRPAWPRAGALHGARHSGRADGDARSDDDEGPDARNTPDPAHERLLDRRLPKGTAMKTTNASRAAAPAATTGLRQRGRPEGRLPRRARHTMGWSAPATGEEADRRSSRRPARPTGPARRRRGDDRRRQPAARCRWRRAGRLGMTSTWTPAASTRRAREAPSQHLRRGHRQRSHLPEDALCTGAEAAEPLG